jgi:hypothetical protein
MKTLPILRGQEQIQIIMDDFLIENMSWIAGGFARWALSPHKKPYEASDIDIFCRDKKIFGFMVNVFSHIFEIRSDNPACIAYNKSKKDRYKNLLPIQLIKPRRDSVVITEGPIEEIINGFDFPVSRAAIMTIEEGLVDDDYEDDELKKKLHLKVIHCPISSTFRVIKYCKKGYSITMREVVKLFADWSDRPESYRIKLLELIRKEEPTQDEIDNLERLLRID